MGSFKHFKLNHKYNFVDPEIGMHTQKMERLWRVPNSEIKYRTSSPGNLDRGIVVKKGNERLI